MVCLISSDLDLTQGLLIQEHQLVTSYRCTSVKAIPSKSGQVCELTAHVCLERRKRKEG